MSFYMGEVVCGGICCLSIYVSVYMIVDCAFPSVCSDLSTALRNRQWLCLSGVLVVCMFMSW